jgi:hypothetical protein
MAYKTNEITVIGDNRELQIDKIIHNSANSFISVTDSAVLYGYTSGGNTPGSEFSTVDRFSFSVDSNASDVGDLSTTRYHSAGHSSSTHGYTSGGFGFPFSPSVTALIDKFPFSTSSFTATNVGSLTVARYRLAGHSSSTHGYASAGNPPPLTNTSNVIDRFPFSVDSNATDVGDLTSARWHVSGQNSSTHGYTSGGIISPSPYTDSSSIDKFSFASSNNNSEIIGQLLQARAGTSGNSSEIAGYVLGGQTGPASNTSVADVDKFPFAVSAPVSAVTDLITAVAYSAGQSSYAYGYNSGGNPGTPAPVTAAITKFSFATDGSHSSVGDLTISRREAAGQNI